jgi:uncharacterized protein (TIGR03435 family)
LRQSCVAIIVFAGTTLAPAGYSQQATTLPTFEVATIRRSDPKKPLPPSIKFVPGRFEASNVTLNDLIAMAFDTRQQISGGPGWIDSEKFDIVAKEDKNVMAHLNQLGPEQKGEQYRSMIQELLTDRFKLSVRREKKELTTYTLLLAKGGSRLKPGVLDPKLPANIPQARINVRGPGFWEGHNTNTALLVKMLSSQSELGGRLVIDKTGLSGTYDFTLKWTRESAAIDSQPSGPEAQETLPQLFTALQEQLGLRLANAKAPVEIIVVEHAELPSEN